MYTTLIQPKDSNLAASPFRPYDSDHEFGYKSLKLSQTPTGRFSNVSNFRSPVETPSRPKFEPIDKYSTTSKVEQFNQYSQQQNLQQQQQQHQLYKPKAISAQQIAPFKSDDQYSQQTQYYRGVASVPQHLPSVARETSNRMHVHEHTDHSRRVVDLSQTKRVYQFDRNFRHLATPHEFVPEELRDGPVHIPRPSVPRSSSVPRSYERILTPMEFDTVPPQMPSKIDLTPIKCRADDSYQTQTLDRYSKRSTYVPARTRDDIGIHSSHGGQYSESHRWNSQRQQWESQQQNQQWQNRQQQLQQKWQNQQQQQQQQEWKNQQQQQQQWQSPNANKPILKRSPGGTDSSQFYRNESKVSQHGKLYYNFDCLC